MEPVRQTKPGNLSDKIDRQLLHEYLWMNRARGDFYPVSQKELAEKLGVTIFTLSRVFRELRDEGRVEKIRGKYRIFDPAHAAWTQKPDTLFD